MDMLVLKKRISTFRTSGGSLRNLSDELILDILKTWESWTGKSRDLYVGLGVNRQSMARIIGKAKKLSREGAGGEFKEMSMESILGPPQGSGLAIEVAWDSNKIIRFPSVDHLIDFLKKVA